MNYERTARGLALVVLLTVTGCGHDEPQGPAAGAISSDPWWLQTHANEPSDATPVVVRNPFALDGDDEVAIVEPEPPKLPGPPPLTLQGVVVWSGHTMAVIDGKQYRLGEVVPHRKRDWMVTAISAEPPSVTLRWTDGEHEVESILEPVPSGTNR